MSVPTSIAERNNPAEGGTANIIYILYLVGIVAGITWVVGLFMAYIYRRDAPYWVQSHYRFQIRTFWVGLLYYIFAAVMIFLLLFPGFIVAWLLVVALIEVWAIVRCVKGMMCLARGEPYPDETTWIW